MKSFISHYGRRGQRSMYDLILDAIDELPKGLGKDGFDILYTMYIIKSEFSV
jgi:hypothetical protein